MSYIDKIFPNPLPTVEELEAKYKRRDLPDGAKVTRVAPSPTGFMHIGGIYTALICERVAHQSNGVFFLRIEDTDTKREVEGATELICSSLANYDIIPDEGFDAFGNEIGSYAPYKQSARKEINICGGTGCMSSDSKRIFEELTINGQKFEAPLTLEKLGEGYNHSTDGGFYDESTRTVCLRLMYNGKSLAWVYLDDCDSMDDTKNKDYKAIVFSVNDIHEEYKDSININSVELLSSYEKLLNRMGTPTVDDGYNKKTGKHYSEYIDMLTSQN